MRFTSTYAFTRPRRPLFACRLSVVCHNHYNLLGVYMNLYPPPIKLYAGSHSTHSYTAPHKRRTHASLGIVGGIAGKINCLAAVFPLHILIDRY